MAKCIIRQAVEFPDSAGIYAWRIYLRDMELPRVPVAGDWVCWNEDEKFLLVRRVTLQEFSAVVDVAPIRTDDQDLLAKLDSRDGWYRA